MQDYSYTRRVNFADTDAATIAHFTSLLTYAEEAEHEMLRQLGYPISVSPGDYGWPRVHCELSIDSPLHLGDEVVLRPRIEALGRSSISWCWDLTRKEGGDHLALIRMTTVCGKRSDHNDSFSSTPLPEDLRTALTAYLAD